MPNYTPNFNLVKPLVTEQYDIAKVTNDNADILDSEIQAVKDDVLDKQDTLVSGTNIKTINGNSVLGSGDLPISSGVKNQIINGNFQVNQRAKTGTVTLTAGQYGHDRWKAGASGCTYTFATVENITTLTISAGSLIQVIEGLNLETGTYCLSWEGTAQGKIGAGSYGASGITGSVVGGTNLNIEFNTGTLKKVSFVKGSTPETFIVESYDNELSKCLRYYERGLIGANGVTVGTTEGYMYARYKVVKRAYPNLSVIPGSSLTNSVSEIGVSERTPTSFVFESDVNYAGIIAVGATYSASGKLIKLRLDIIQAEAEL